MENRDAMIICNQKVADELITQDENFKQVICICPWLDEDDAILVVDKSAWDAARKIVLSREDGGLFNYESRKAVLGCGNYMALKKFLAQEAIEKIRQYEQEQEEIKVGDEVQHRSHSGIKVIVLNKDGDAITAIAVTNVPFACKVGEMYINRNAKDWKKTGKHYEIAEVLRKMQEEKEK